MENNQLIPLPQRYIIKHLRENLYIVAVGKYHICTSENIKHAKVFDSKMWAGYNRSRITGFNNLLYKVVEL